MRTTKNLKPLCDIACFISDEVYLAPKYVRYPGLMYHVLHRGMYSLLSGSVTREETHHLTHECNPMVRNIRALSVYTTVSRCSSRPLTCTAYIHLDTLCPVSIKGIGRDFTRVHGQFLEHFLNGFMALLFLDFLQCWIDVNWM